MGDIMKFNAKRTPKPTHKYSDGQVAEILWQLLDDIDTAGDMFKPEINDYFKYVQKKVEERFQLIGSDGYKLIWPEKPTT